MAIALMFLAPTLWLLVRERRAHLRHRALLERTEAMPFECDPVARVAPHMPPQLARLLGCDVRELASVEFLRSRIHPDDLSRVAGTMYAYARGTHTASTPFEYRMIGAGGRLVHLRAFLSQRAFDGTRVRGVMLDVTRWRVLEEEVRHSQRVEVTRALVADVAHELNTPIQFVDDSLQFAREVVAELVARLPSTPDLVELPKALDRALEGTARVAAVVKSMGSLGRRTQRERVPIDVIATVDRAIAAAYGACEPVADIVRSCDAVPAIDGHPRELDQVLRALVEHAARAVAATGRRGTITIATRTSARDVVISVTDTGSGVLAEGVLDPFYETAEGLAATRAVVEERFGGSLTAASTAGIGTTFILRLPTAHRLELAA